MNLLNTSDNFINKPNFTSIFLPFKSNNFSWFSEHDEKCTLVENAHKEIHHPEIIKLRKLWKKLQFEIEKKHIEIHSCKRWFCLRLIENITGSRPIFHAFEWFRCIQGNQRCNIKYVRHSSYNRTKALNKSHKW